jgi:Xaa-Pro dipeptidase
LIHARDGTRNIRSRLDSAAFENLKDTGYYADAEYVKFSDVEFKRRYSLARDAMQQRNLDCLIVLGGSDVTSFGGGVQWLSGLFDRRQVCQYLIVPFEGEPTLVYARGGAHIEAVRRSVYVQDVRPPHGGKYGKVIAERIRELGLRTPRVGITGVSPRPDSDILPANQFESLRRQLPDAEFVLSFDLLHRLIHLKSDEEIQRVKSAGKLCDAAVKAMAERAKPGVSEYQLAAAAAHAIMDGGGEPHLLIVGSTPMSNPNLFFGNPRPSGRKLKQGDIIISELAAWYNGCSAQIGRPICVGQPPSDVNEFFNSIVLEGYKQIALRVKPGNTLEDVRAAAQFFRNHGYQSRPLIMHGFDVVTSSPFVRVEGVEAEEYEMTIKPRMCYMLEPNPIRPDGKFGIFYGNTLLITDDGQESATNYPPILTVVS